MRVVLRWMWPYVHPDRARLLVRADVVLDRDERLRFRIPLFPDAQLQRTAIDVRRHVDSALMLFERQPRRIPTEGPLPRRVVDGESEIVDELGAGNALGEILVIARRPTAGEIGLRAGGGRREHDHQPD